MKNAVVSIVFLKLKNVHRRPGHSSIPRKALKTALDIMGTLVPVCPLTHSLWTSFTFFLDKMMRADGIFSALSRTTNSCTATRRAVAEHLKLLVLGNSSPTEVQGACCGAVSLDYKNTTLISRLPVSLPQ